MRVVAQNVGKLLLIWGGQGVTGGLAYTAVQAVGPSPIRDLVLVLIWPIVIIAGTILAAIWLYRSPETAPGGPGPYGGIRPEWATATQVEHWEGVRKLALGAYAEFRRVANTPTVNVRDRNSLQSLIDEVDGQTGQYGQLWSGSGNSFWDEHERNRWQRNRGRYDGPGWGRDLWERIDYANWWIRTHDPMNPEPAQAEGEPVDRYEPDGRGTYS
jgi:hypothetical protein